MINQLVYHRNNFSYYYFNLYSEYIKNINNITFLHLVESYHDNKAKIDRVYYYDRMIIKRNKKLINILYFLGVGDWKELNFNKRIPNSPFYLFSQNAIISFYESYHKFDNKLNKILFSLYFSDNAKNKRMLFNNIFEKIELYYKFLSNYHSKGNKYIIYDYLDYLIHKGYINNNINDSNPLFKINQDDIDFLYKSIKDIQNFRYDYNSTEKEGRMDIIHNINAIKEYITGEKYENIY